jgi:hypothetical protein
MRVLGSVLILVIVMHSQCLNACALDLFLGSAQASPAAAPPCHQLPGSSSDRPHDSRDHSTNNCGFGLVVEFKSTLGLKCNSNLPAHDLFVLAEMSDLQDASVAAQTLRHWIPASSLPPSLPQLILRV